MTGLIDVGLRSKQDNGREGKLCLGRNLRIGDNGELRQKTRVTRESVEGSSDLFLCC